MSFLRGVGTRIGGALVALLSVWSLMHPLPRAPGTPSDFHYNMIIVWVSGLLVGLIFVLRGPQRYVDDRETGLRYASFRQRLLAMLADALVLVPIFYITEIWGVRSRTLALAIELPYGLLFPAYFIYCHGRWGQTIGKRLLGIRVVRETGEPITWRHAWLRSAVDVMFAVIAAIGSYVGMSLLSDADLGLPWMERADALIRVRPHWQEWTDTAALAWGYSEVIVMLLNRRRRALHDFIAGTLVIAVEPHPVPAALPA